VHSNAEEQKLVFNEKEIIPAQYFRLYMFGLYYRDKSFFVSKKIRQNSQKK